MEAQYEVLRPFVTERILSLTRGRLLEGVKFFNGNSLHHEYSRSEVKLALLLVKIGNPDESLTDNEKELLSTPMRQQKVKECCAQVKRIKSAN